MLEPKPDPMIARDLVGYGEFPPNPAWPGGALIAVNFNLNVEGGGEASLFNGDQVSEGMLNDIGVPAYRGRRAPLVESVFEFGSRRGVWRVLDIFRDHSVAVSILGVARALEQNPRLALACVERGHEIVSHGYRWIDYVDVPEDVERQHIRQAIDILKTLTGAQPARLDDRPARPQHATVDRRGRRVSVRSRFARRRVALLARMFRANPTWSSPIRTKPTTIASTRTAGFRPGRSSSPTCATHSTFSTARARKALRSCSPLACMTG